MIQAPWVGNPDYGRNWKYEEKQQQEELQMLEERLDDQIMMLEEKEDDLKYITDIEKYEELKEEIEMDRLELKRIQEEIEDLEEL